MKNLTSSTSIENYHFKIKGEFEENQDEIILDAVKKFQPCTGRIIWEALNKKIENSSIARSLNNLKKKSKITSPYSDKCPITGVKVQWYVTIDNSQLKAF